MNSEVRLSNTLLCITRLHTALSILSPRITSTEILTETQLEPLLFFDMLSYPVEPRGPIKIEFLKLMVS